MNDLSPPEPDAALARLVGSPLAPQRLAEVLVAYAPIFDEIAKLRQLELREIHPAVIFEPTAPYRRESS